MLQHSFVLPAPEISSATLSTPERTCHWVAFCVSRDFGPDMLALFAPTRGPPRAAFARQVAMYLARRHTKSSLNEIGDAFGGRDHGTVLHACKTVQDRMGREDQVRQLEFLLTSQLER